MSLKPPDAHSPRTFHLASVNSSSATKVEAVAGSDLRGISDKYMLRLANGRYDALVTMDKSIIHRQNLKDDLLIIVLMRGPNNRYETLARMAPQVLRFLEESVPGAIGIMVDPSA